MSPNAGRIRRRRPRPSIVVPPERDVTTGRYSKGLGHEDKQQHEAARRGGRSARPRVWMVAAAAVGVAAVGVAAVALSNDGDEGTTIATTTLNAATTVSVPSATIPPTTVAAPLTTPPPPSSTSTSTIPAPLPPATPADALAGRYRVTALVTGDSLVPDRVGSSVPFEPLVLMVACEADVCTVTDRIWGTATLVDDTLSFAFSSAVPCLDATRLLDSVVELAVAERDALGFVETLEGTAKFTWGAAVSGSGPRCPGFVEDFSLVAVRA